MQQPLPQATASWETVNPSPSKKGPRDEEKSMNKTLTRNTLYLCAPIHLGKALPNDGSLGSPSEVRCRWWRGCCGPT